MFSEFVDFAVGYFEVCNGQVAFKFSAVEVWNQSVEASAECGFSAAAWTCKNYKVSFFDFYGDISDRLLCCAWVSVGEIFCLDESQSLAFFFMRTDGR